MFFFFLILEYSTVSQFANHDKYISCDNTTTAVPDGKVCRYTADRFGNHCQQMKLYGYGEGRPCILLLLIMASLYEFSYIRCIKCLTHYSIDTHFNASTTDYF